MKIETENMIYLVTFYVIYKTLYIFYSAAHQMKIEWDAATK